MLLGMKLTSSFSFVYFSFLVDELLTAFSVYVDGRKTKVYVANNIDIYFLLCLKITAKAKF